ncbi:Solute carrier family 35 member B1 [Durusdinium trenchii]|uniref:Solute carrier family 35 member B1 n=1 Tax=Durusdinium trenchii TaxID=1381693 RepID=A0ABP0KNU5_9DINO
MWIPCSKPDPPPMEDSGSLEFPMYSLKAETFLGLRIVLKHEDAHAAGYLVEFFKDQGSAIFISHQWLSRSHPDPQGTQLQDMQNSLRNILNDAGHMQISPHPATQMYFCSQPTNYASRFRGKTLLIWYDYLCIPQENHQQRCQAIRSIPAYVARCDFFVALCPPCQHLETQEALNQYTWGARG